MRCSARTRLLPWKLPALVPALVLVLALSSLVAGQISAARPGDGRAETSNPTHVEETFVIGALVQGQAYAFPLAILQYQQIVNMQIRGVAYALTYSTLTHSVLLVRLANPDDQLEPSDVALMSNLVVQTRSTSGGQGVRYSQLIGPGMRVQKNLFGERLVAQTASVMLWGAWKALYPDTLVLSDDTGVSRDYFSNPLPVNYPQTNVLKGETCWSSAKPPYSMQLQKDVVLLVYPELARYEDTLVPADTPVAPLPPLVSVTQHARNTMLLPWRVLSQNPVNNFAMRDGTPFVVMVHRATLLTMVWSSRVNGTTAGVPLLFHPVDSSRFAHDVSVGMPMMADQFGDVWNIYGVCVDGARRGQRLHPMLSTPAYWFAAVSLFPTASVYVEPYSRFARSQASVCVRDGTCGVDCSKLRHSSFKLATVDKPVFQTAAEWEASRPSVFLQVLPILAMMLLASVGMMATWALNPRSSEERRRLRAERRAEGHARRRQRGRSRSRRGTGERADGSVAGSAVGDAAVDRFQEIPLGDGLDEDAELRASALARQQQQAEATLRAQEALAFLDQS